MQLADEQAIVEATHALNSCKKEVLQLVNEGIDVQFKGLDLFGDRVLYLKVGEGGGAKKLHALATIVYDAFKRHEDSIRSKGGTLTLVPTKFSFTPHVTICKTSKQPNRSVAIKRDTIHDLMILDFGSCKLKKIELLSMAGLDPDGYYKTCAVLNASVAPAAPAATAAVVAHTEPCAAHVASFSKV
jgi:2'-5' RNA ligase